MTPTTIPLKNRKLAALLAFLVPGLGHAYQRRFGKALLYFLCIYGLFFGGMALGDFKILYWRWVSPLADSEHFCYWYFWQVLTGIAALPSVVQATLQHYGYPTILWGYGAEPTAEAFNALYHPYGKLLEIGYIYTQAAGLLNILAIFDAYEGPANGDEALAKRPAEAVAAAPAKAEDAK